MQLGEAGLAEGHALHWDGPAVLQCCNNTLCLLLRACRRLAFSYVRMLPHLTSCEWHKQPQQLPQQQEPSTASGSGASGSTGASGSGGGAGARMVPTSVSFKHTQFEPSELAPGGCGLRGVKHEHQEAWSPVLSLVAHLACAQTRGMLCAPCMRRPRWHAVP